MRYSTLATIVIAVGLMALAPGQAAIRAQDDSGDKKPGDEMTGQPVPDSAVVSPEARKTLTKIMRDREDVLTGTRFTYDPAGRRDPFRSLIEQVRRRRDAAGLKGIRGMAISEIDLVGVVENPEGNVAFFHGSDNKGYFLRIGDEVYDGKLIGINAGSGEVTFRQRVDDPRQIKPYRDITKRLVPLEEEG